MFTSETGMAVLATWFLTLPSVWVVVGVGVLTQAFQILRANYGDKSLI